MASSLTLQSPAKLNLFLHIIGRRPDGYHLLQTVFQLINYCDTLQFQLRDDNQIVLTGDTPDIPPENNLIMKAALQLREERHDLPGVDIRFEKRIPMGAGLGGGSSNAATTLLALNKLWALNKAQAELISIGLKLGADVPLFVMGHSAFAEGIGEILTPIELPTQWYAVIKPPVHADTRALYQDPRLTRNTKPLTIAEYCAGVATHNDFLAVLLAQYPILHETYDMLKQFGEPKLTGSGSAFFLACETREKAEKCIGQMNSQVVAFVAQGVERSPGL